MLITINAVTIPDWPYGGSTATLEIGPLVPFLARDNHFVNYRKLIECEIGEGQELVVPEIELYSTTDSANPLAEYYTRIQDHKRKWRNFLIPGLETFQLPIELGTPVDWAYLAINNGANNIPPDEAYYNKNQIDYLFSLYRVQGIESGFIAPQLASGGGTISYEGDV